MAVYDLEEQEQLDELKTWWKQHGNLVTSLLLAVALVAAGWQGWNWWQRNQAAEASTVFAGLQQAAIQRDAKRAKELAGQLIDKYSGSMYAGMGVLVSARLQVEAGDTKTAKAQLTWAADKGADASLRDLARLRLAIVLVDEKAYDEAMIQVGKASSATFQARFGEIKGDILAAQGKAVEARDAYEAALKQADAAAKLAASDAANPAAGNYLEMLQSKRDSLTGGKQ